MKWIRNNLIVRYVLSYVIIMAIPLALAVRIMMYSVELSYNSAYNATVGRLAQSARIIDQNLDSLWNYEVQLEEYLTDAGFFSVPDMLEQRDSVPDYNRIRSRLPSMMLGNIAHEIVIYSRRGNCVLDRKGVTPMERVFGSTVAGLSMADERPDWSAFFNTFYRYAAIPMNTWSLYNAQRTVRYVPLANTVVGRRGEALGNVVLLLNENSLLSLSGFVGNDYLAGFIVDRNGNRILGYNPQDAVLDPGDIVFSGTDDSYQIADIDGTDCLVTRFVGSAYGWQYIAVMPLDGVRENVSALYRSTILLIGALVVIGAVLVAVMTYTNARPIHRLLMAIRQEKGETPDYSHMDSAVSDLVAGSAALRRELDRQIPDMRNALFSRWLHGEFMDWEAFAGEYQRVGVKLDGNHYGVVLLRYEYADTSEDHKSDHAIIKTLLQEEMDSVIGVYDMNYNTMVFVVKSDLTDRRRFLQEVEKGASALSQTLSGRMKIDTLFAGGVTAQATGVNIAYEEAQRAMEKAAELSPSNLPPVMWYDGSQQAETGSLYYPIEAELRLIDSMKSGSTDGAARVLNQIFRENFTGETVDGALLRQLIQMLRGTLFRFFRQVSRDGGVYHNALQQIADTLDDAPDRAALRRVEDLFFSVCRDAEEYNRLKSEKLTQRIDRYIDDNWRDPLLSLQTMADYIGYSTAYMSRIFKQEKGESFVHYVEGYRMREAAKMIEAGDKPIEEIAAACGYASAQVFRRAFRRTYDCSPIEYSLRIRDGQDT